MTKIKKMIEERRKTRKKVTLSLDRDYYNDLKKLSERNNIPISHLIDAAIEIAFADSFFNPDKDNTEEEFD